MIIIIVKKKLGWREREREGFGFDVFNGVLREKR